MNTISVAVRRGTRTACALVTVIALAACDNNDNAEQIGTGQPGLVASREFRAIAGVSMGAYGAMNLGTKHTDMFGTVASLGGPVDMTQLLRDGIDDNLEVKAQTDTPRDVDGDFTFDHLAPYPDRDTRVSMLQDLILAFGNPFLHHPDPSRPYFAADSEPAQLRRDDQFDAFELVADRRSFSDGGDANADGLRQQSEGAVLPTDVLLLAAGSLPGIATGASGVVTGGRALADLNGDGVFDVGEGIVVNLSEPFTDSNANRVYEPDLGETFMDNGLDGVAGTGDFGEGNGRFDYDPDREHWLAEDPLTRVAARSASEIATQRIYMDVGTKDEFKFAQHYANFVQMLEDKGVEVTARDGFSDNCANLPSPQAQFLWVRYDAGHVGVASVDPDDLLVGNVCGSDTIWQRILSMVGYLNESFPDGLFGPGDDFEPPDIDFDDLDIDFPDLDPRGDMVAVNIESQALQPSDGAAAPAQHVRVYVPPAFFHTDADFPVVYFLGGYGQRPEDFDRMRDLLDALVLTGQLQNMYFAFLPGQGGQQGSFYVNHAMPEAVAPNIEQPTSGRYEDAIINDLIPEIEGRVLDGRVRN